MSDTAVNVLAIAVFLMTLSVLLGPLIQLSPLVPTFATLALVGLVTVDQWGWQGKGTTLFLGSIASKAQKQRILHHEAGHFLVAHYLGIAIQDYSLSAWEAFQKGRSGQGAVEFIPQDLTEQLQDWQNRPLLLERLATVWMAGIAAEQVIYGQAEGGSEDRQQLQAAFNLAGLPSTAFANKESWALLQAKNLIMTHRSAYDVLVEAMGERRSVSECCILLKENSIQF